MFTKEFKIVEESIGNLPDTKVFSALKDMMSPSKLGMPTVITGLICGALSPVPTKHSGKYIGWICQLGASSKINQVFEMVCKELLKLMDERFEKMHFKSRLMVVRMLADMAGEGVAPRHADPVWRLLLRQVSALIIRHKKNIYKYLDCIFSN